MTFDLSTFISAVILGLNTALVVIMARYVPGYWRRVPWLAPLIAYFVLRVALRAVNVEQGHSDFGVELLLDAALVPVLILLAVSVGRMLRGFILLQDEAQLKRDEYERAQREYEQLMRHRIANPLTVLDGSVTTLLDHPELDAATRTELFKGMAEAVDRLRSLSTDVETSSVEEQSLDAQARIN